MEKNILLLQGPMGPFFSRLAKDLRAEGWNVFKINFNGGDSLFYRGRNSVPYRGTLQDWPQFLSDKVAEWDISHILLFGDMRHYHKMVADFSELFGVKVYVFEEGYLRPNFITLEKDGVNGRSSIPRDPAFFNKVTPINEQETRSPNLPFTKTTLYAIAYYLATWLTRWRYPHYQHHRHIGWSEAYVWIRSGIRKINYRQNEQGIQEELTGKLSGKYFLGILQVHNDAQIREWSDIPSASAFIKRTIKSFALDGNPDEFLVIKHHPLDRGYSDYKPLIRQLARKYKIKDRVYYIHDQHLPSLLKHARGTLVINSTVGLSSLLHNTPVYVCGHAVYDMPGLTFQGNLSDFWKQPGEVDKELNQQFRKYLICANQINGHFYAKTKPANSWSGLDMTQLNNILNRDAARVENTEDCALSPATKRA
jgi:capsule polysaccharide modification protein KpsS